MARDALTSDIVHTAVQRWERANLIAHQRKMELRRAEQDEADAELALGKLLVPANARVGETFQIWVRRNEEEERLLNIHLYATPTGTGIEVGWRPLSLSISEVKG